MDIQAYKETGILELYVYGLLDENGNREVRDMARQYPEVEQEIISIELAIVNLSTSFSPHLSAENFARIKEQLEIKYSRPLPIRRKTYFPTYIGWAAAILLLAAIGVQYVRLDQANRIAAQADIEKTRLQEQLATAAIEQKQMESAMGVVREKNSEVVTLGGQAVSPQSYAKVFYNKSTSVVYVDGKGLPEPPEGKVYQVWALKLSPLTPTSIGLLEHFTADNQKIFAVDKAVLAEGFGITLEPAGGSASPTMEQLYTLGKV